MIRSGTTGAEYENFIGVDNFLALKIRSRRSFEPHNLFYIFPRVVRKNLYFLALHHDNLQFSSSGISGSKGIACGARGRFLGSDRRMDGLQANYCTN